MRKTRIKAKVADLVLNEGQLDWLPRNPRQWTQTDIDRTKASLERDPDFQEDNPLKAVLLPGGQLLVFAGNLRTTAARALGWETFETIVYEPKTKKDRETVIRRAMLDNGSFGSWDADRVADEWERLAEAQGFTLADWGAPEWMGTPQGSLDTGDEGAGSGSGSAKAEKKPHLQALITFPDADALSDFAAKYAPEIIEQYNAEIIY